MGTRIFSRWTWWGAVAATMAVGSMATIEARRDSAPASSKGNRLRFEKSPYLLQHADNPVDWYPWGDEAFEKARTEDKPIYLSIGYSTCHWCHVMAHESFEDDEVAALMNRAFVSVKVDREERPDIDDVYMTVCQMMTGSGGWPLTVLMTPEKKPFFAGTYFPKRTRPGRIGMKDLVPRVEALWKTKRDELRASAGRVTEMLGRLEEGGEAAAIGAHEMERAFAQLEERYDRTHGGFGGAPKFPTPHSMLSLLRYEARTGNARALEMVENTLRAMRRGGIYDHVGFGFHRYATDREWLVPHFEKMLYDQAQLVMAYTEAFQVTGRAEYESTAREILRYVLRDMTSPAGAFYSAEDADIEGEEGAFYLWTPDELAEVLGEEDGRVAATVFGVTAEGNFEIEATGKKNGRSILHLERSPAETASGLDMKADELISFVERARKKLYAAREKRVHPHKDDKILADWNGLMIAALAKAAVAFDDTSYVDAARRAADFLLGTMRDRDGRLLHRYRDGEAAVRGYLDDYAFLGWGLMELYRASFDTRYLEAARDITAVMRERFSDPKGGGLFFTADDAEALLVRKKDNYDGAVPAGSSVAMLNMLRLGRIMGDTKLEEAAVDIGRAASASVRRVPSAHTQLLCAVDFETGPSYEVVIAGRPGADDTEAMLKALARAFLPRAVVLLRPTRGVLPGIVDVAPYTKYQVDTDGAATAYVCARGACKAPTTDPSEMMRLLNRTATPGKAGGE